jgi:hypothetical protein
MKFNINTASKAQLLTIKGVGSTLADRILWWQENQGFEKLTDLMKIKGIKANVFSEAQAMGIYCKDPEKEKEMKERDDIRTLVRWLTATFILGYLRHGGQWASERKEETKKLWKQHNGNMEYFGLAISTAKDKFSMWKEDQTVRIYDDRNWVELGEADLKKAAEKEAYRWAGGLKPVFTQEPITSMAELAVFNEMVQTIYEEGEERRKEMVDKAYRVYNPTFNRLLVMINDMCGVQTPPTWRKLRQESMDKAEKLWTRAWYEANGIILDEAADQPSEGSAHIDNMEDLANGFDLDIPDTLAIEQHSGQMEGFYHEPNWTQIFYMKREGEEAFETWQHHMRVILKENMRGEYDHKRKAAELFKYWNKILWDLHQDKDKVRTHLMLMGNPLGMIKKTDLQTLSKNCHLAVKVLFPKWTYYPKVILSYEEHMKQQGQEKKAKHLMEKREQGDQAQRQAHERQKEMSTFDFGRTSEDGDWTPTDMVDESMADPEQQLIQAEIWFD